MLTDMQISTLGLLKKLENHSQLKKIKKEHQLFSQN